MSRTFPGRTALENLSFEVDEGEIFGFLGPNGAGKTTTLRILTGQLRPTSGSCRVLGLDPLRQGRELRRRVGVMFEDGGHYDRLSVRANLGFFARLYGAGPDRVERLLREFALWDRRKDGVEKLSRGMRQRLALARALVGSPEVLFLDEPTAGLDPVAARGVRSLVRSFCRNGGTVFLTTHYMEEASELCSRVAILDQGRLLALGTVEDLCRHPEGKLTLEEVFVRTAGRRLVEAVEPPANP
ncbi:MAG: ABC transporter ATP-binding protein [Candidatus Eremiobacterota bacterium]